MTFVRFLSGRQTLPVPENVFSLTWLSMRVFLVAQGCAHWMKQSSSLLAHLLKWDNIPRWMEKKRLSPSALHPPQTRKYPHSGWDPAPANCQDRVLLFPYRNLSLPLSEFSQGGVIIWAISIFPREAGESTSGGSLHFSRHYWDPAPLPVRSCFIWDQLAPRTCWQYWSSNLFSTRACYFFSQSSPGL